MRNNPEMKEKHICRPRQWAVTVVCAAAACAIGLSAAPSISVAAPSNPPRTLAARTTGPAAGSSVRILPVRDNIYLVSVNEDNITVQAGPDGLIVVDTGGAGTSREVLAAIHQISPLPIRYVVDTSASPDRTGGNAALSEAGVAFSSGFLGSEAPIIATQQVLLSMSNAPQGAVPIFYPRAALPSITYEGRRSLHLNGEAEVLIAQPSAHSDGDSVVVFDRSEVVVAGDIIDMTRFPVIDIAQGGSVQGEIDALDRILELAVPVTPLIWHAGGTVVVPGHGRLAEQEEVVQYRDMVVTVRDRIQYLIKQHQALAQIEEGDPTAGFDSRYGSISGEWTTHQFVEAVYRSLISAAPHPDRHL